MRSILICAAMLAGLAMSAPATAQVEAARSAQAVEALEACRTVADDGARLACFDAAAERLSTARAKGEVVVVDKEQLREARREAFGFNLPSLSLFGRAGQTIEEEEGSDRATFTVESARKGGDGRWIITMENGMVWRQTDTTVGMMRIRKGSKAEVRKGMLGAYFMNIDDYRAIKVERAR